MGPWTRWVLETLMWVVIACIVVSLIWGPDPYSLGITAAISIAISAVLGNGFRR